MKAVIPAAGLGMRMLPLTKAQPKEMLPVAGKPAIQHVVEEAVRSGMKDVLIITGKGKRAIEDHFDHCYELESILSSKGDEKSLELLNAITNLAEIYYVRQKETKGLGDAVMCSQAYIGGHAFAVLLGDTIACASEKCTQIMLNIHRARRVSVLAVERVPPEKVSRYGIIKAEPMSDGVGKVVDLVEKPSMDRAPSNLAIFGRYILTPTIYDCIEKTPPGFGGEIQLTDAIKLLLQKEEVLAYEVRGSRYDIGSKIDWQKANIEMSLDDLETGRDLEIFLNDLLKKRKLA